MKVKQFEIRNLSMFLAFTSTFVMFSVESVIDYYREQSRRNFHALRMIIFFKGW